MRHGRHHALRHGWSLKNSHAGVMIGDEWQRQHRDAAALTLPQRERSRSLRLAFAGAVAAGTRCSGGVLRVDSIRHELFVPVTVALCIAMISCYHDIMAKSTHDTMKARKTRAPETG